MSSLIYRPAAARDPKALSLLKSTDFASILISVPAVLLSRSILRSISDGITALISASLVVEASVKFAAEFGQGATMKAVVCGIENVGPRVTLTTGADFKTSANEAGDCFGTNLSAIS